MSLLYFESFLAVAGDVEGSISRFLIGGPGAGQQSGSKRCNVAAIDGFNDGLPRDARAVDRSFHRRRNKLVGHCAAARACWKTLDGMTLK
jgi:hypothetical protein